MERAAKAAWLRRFRQLDSEWRACWEELRFWEEKAGRLVGVYGERVGKGGVSPDLGDAAAQIVELEAELRGRLEGLVACRRAIGAAIEGVEDARLRHLLVLRYVEGLTLEEVAERMFYSWRQVQRLHGQALDVLVVPEGV